jgi:biopolymer transport protein ExbB
MSILKTTKAIFCAALLAPAMLAAEDIQSVADGAASDLQKALAELSTARQEVENERLPLARRVRELEQKLTEKRVEYARAQRFQENQLVELNALKTETRQRGDEVKFVESLLAEYVRAFRSRLTFAEEPRYAAGLDAVDKAAAAPDLTGADRFTRRAELLTTSLARAEKALGGEIFDGKALDKQGRVQTGKVALVGPVAMFAGPGPETAGLLQMELNKSDPTLVTVAEVSQADIRSLATTGAGTLLLDPTLGNAFKMSALHLSFYHQLKQGGLIMIPLLGVGAASILLAIFKYFQLAKIRVAKEADLQKVLDRLENNDAAGALAHARSIPGVVGDLLATAVEHSDEKKEYIEELLYEKMLGARAKIERGLAFLALAATTGPLLGLLGTVMGMIATFKMISMAGSGDPKQLAAGISEALICTATGMAVAIPSLLLHSFLSRKAKGIIGSMEHTAVGFINGVPNEQNQTFVS